MVPDQVLGRQGHSWHHESSLGTSRNLPCKFGVNIFSFGWAIRVCYMCRKTWRTDKPTNRQTYRHSSNLYKTRCALDIVAHTEEFGRPLALLLGLWPMFMVGCTYVPTIFSCLDGYEHGRVRTCYGGPIRELMMGYKHAGVWTYFLFVCGGVWSCGTHIYLAGYEHGTHTHLAGYKYYWQTSSFIYI